MTTARQIITSALTLRLNRLSPGEALDDDLASLGLTALNELADEWSGSGSFLWRELLDRSVSAITGTSGTLGTSWANIEPGQELLGATYSTGTFDYPIAPLTMQQYHENVRTKSLSGGYPQFYAYDGASAVYFYPACTGQFITIRVKQSMQVFVDLDTDYVMPQGYLGGLSAVLAEMLAVPLLGAVPASVAKAASAARNRLAGQASEPGIINGANAPAGNLFTGWR